MGISLLFRTLKTTLEKMKTFIAISCLLALAAAVPAPQYTSKYNKPYQKNSGGYKEDTYKQTGKKECETHYKTVYKTVIGSKNVKMFLNKFAITSRKRFAIKNLNIKQDMAKEPMDTIPTITISQRFATMKINKNVWRNTKMFVTMRP